MKHPSKVLLVFAGLFGVIGAVMGAHMAGSGSHAFRPVHTHVLVVGWLTLFSWAVFYKVFSIKNSLLTRIHVWVSIIGTTGLTAGMYLHMVSQVELPDAVTLIIYIGGGVAVLVSFILFFVQTLIYRPEKD
ncbi:hypothetical protein [Lacicoccus alkaliphilus]|uniref:Cytochrome C and Quinol oxidase polypeptide I n=1 Tax=Lacicoccus alkaliphilus DSM 16010 TaxID=1123231 RepID=A0A1M7AAQ6_9BACL|nr:hypothetical protein [Salinicoccus alkaliphilus]SHL39811.1 hypothetical protein SAMN02745189_00085 [Salinicoccus alkaliphilus DSM 16010]